MEKKSRHADTHAGTGASACVDSRRTVRAATVAAFASMLTAMAVTGGMTESAELGEMRDAMRRLKRVDNLQFTCTGTLQGDGAERGERVEVWSDQLSGSWVAEYYVTDEDGTRRYQKEFCDGRAVYVYIDWNGEWERRQGGSVKTPCLETLTVLPYDNRDIAEAESVRKKGKQKISFQFTQEFLGALSAENMDAAERSFRTYEKSGVSEDALHLAEMTLEQYRRTQQERITAVYTIDAENVLCEGMYKVESVQPQLNPDETGKVQLGGEQKLKLQVRTRVYRYNQAGILNKIEQCRSEVRY